MRAQYEFWARGFVSGHNYANPAHQVKVGAFPGGDELYQRFDQYCRDHPQQSFVEGVMQLVAQLRDSRGAGKIRARQTGSGQERTHRALASVARMQ